MTDSKSFWASAVGKLIRWLAFIALAAGAILQALPPIAVEFARRFKPEMNFLTIILAVLAVSGLTTLGWLWFMLVFGTPLVSCGAIAPNNRVGAVILGTIFILLQGTYVILLLMQGAWISVIYQILFSTAYVAGVIAAHNTDN